MFKEAASYRAEGRRSQEIGDLKEAQTAYQKAIVANPRYADVYNDLGVVLESQGDTTAAEQAYRSSLQINPRLAAAHSNLALLYEKQGRVKEATEHWVARVALSEPNDPWVVRAREKLVAYKVPLPQSPEVLAKKKKLEAATAYEEGREAIRRKDWQSAIEQFQHALELDPLHESSKSSLKEAEDGQRRENDKKFKAVSAAQEKALKKAQGHAPTQPPPAPKLSKPPRVEVQKREVPKQEVPKREVPSREISKEPIVAPPVPKEALALAQSLAEEKEKARQQTVRDLMQQAVSSMRQGRYQDAVTRFDQILLLQPGHAEAAQGLKRAKAASDKAGRQPNTRG